MSVSDQDEDVVLENDDHLKSPSPAPIRPVSPPFALREELENAP
mgnify:CR=1 FL=1